MCDAEQVDEISIEASINDFVKNLEALRNSSPLIWLVMAASLKTANDKYRIFLDDKGKLVEEHGNTKTYNISAQYDQEGKRLSRDVDKLDIEIFLIMRQASVYPTGLRHSENQIALKL